jgi:hypothetical protein
MSTQLEIQLERLGEYLDTQLEIINIEDLEHRIGETGVPAPARSRSRGKHIVGVPPWAIVAAAAVLVVLTIGGTAILLPRSETSAVSPTTVTSEIPAVVLTGVDSLAVSADSLWAWGEDDEVWRYTDGAWFPYFALPSTGDGDPYATYASDTLWMLNDSRVFSLDGDEWVEVIAVPTHIMGLAEDPNSDILWLSTGQALYRWDGEAITNVGFPPNWSDPTGSDSDWGYVDGIVATTDGTVWASGLFAWIPWNGGLTRYDDTTGSWETVRPLGGKEDVPAWSIATSRDGDLWATLSKWSQDWEDPATELPKWALAHLDGDTGEWTVHDENLPEGFPLVRAADNNAVWLTAANPIGNFEQVAGVLRFDGQTWTHYLADTDVTDTVDDIAVAPDGTIWYTQNNSLYQPEP